MSDVGISSQLSLVSTYRRDDDLELIVTVASFHSSLVKVIILAYYHIKTIVPETDSEGISFVLPFTTVTWVGSSRTFKGCQQVTNFATQYLCRKLSYI